jgi:transcription initiation factor IIE alpha subunit
MGNEWYTNYYVCPKCSYRWDDEWDCAVDDDCPNCEERDISPIESSRVFNWCVSNA